MTIVRYRMDNNSTQTMAAEEKAAAHFQHPLALRRTALLAYEFWRARGCPEGSPEQDWYMAEEQLLHQRGLHLAQAA